MELTKKEFAEFLKFMRMSIYYSQKEFIKALGIKNSTYINYETGRKFPEDLDGFEKRVRVLVKREIKRQRVLIEKGDSEFFDFMDRRKRKLQGVK